MARANSPTAMVPAPGRAVLEKPTTRAPRITRSQGPMPRAGTSAASSGMVSEPISGVHPPPEPSARAALHGLSEVSEHGGHESIGALQSPSSGTVAFVYQPFRGGRRSEERRVRAGGGARV